jgi:TRAP-type C4-dicarboxylate transport system permease small subunit
MLEKVLNVYAKLMESAIVILVSVLLLTVGLQIIGRYADFIPRYLWTEELANFSLTWMILLGAILGVRERRHFFVDVLPERMHPAVSVIVDGIYYAAMMIMALVFIRYGFQFAMLGLVQRSVVLRVNLIVVYIAVPFTGVSWLLFLIHGLRQEIAESKRSEEREQGGDTK